jgi:hypothetical protein
MLLEKIERLEFENMQLNAHIFKIESENKQLKTILSIARYAIPKDDASKLYDIIGESEQGLIK